MRKYTGKHLGAFLRNQNYAHAGEEEAISMVMNKFDKKKEQTILDVGCGLGGTASFIQHAGWGQVTGFDIEAASIAYAKKNYPNVNFYISDATKIAEIFHNNFDILCAFNSLYAFRDQTKALAALNMAAKPNARLAIFDYLDLCENSKNSLYRNEANGLPFIPIKPSTIGEILKKAGWSLLEHVVINEKYEAWYSNLVSALVNNKEKVIKKFSINMYDSAHHRYTGILNAIIKKELGGVIVYAIKSKCF